MPPFNNSISYTGAIAAGDEGTANLLNSLYLQRDTFANIPDPGNAGVAFLSTDGPAGAGGGDYLYRDNGTSWDGLGYLVNASAQTFAGVKTFSSIPELPASNPTTGNQAVRKDFVDAAVASSVVTLNNPTSETDGAVVNVPTAGGILWFMGRYTAQNAAGTFTVRFYDPTPSLVTARGWLVVVDTTTTGGNAWMINGTSTNQLGSGDLSVGVFIACLKPAAAGNHKVTFQVSTSNAQHQVSSTGSWTL